MESSVHLSTAQSLQTTAEATEMCDVPYRKAVGLLMYASLGMRPDITYAVSVLSRFSENPGRAHWDAVKHMFRYLAGTKNLKLTYGAVQFDLVGYTNTDGSMHKDCKAILGYAFLINGGAVSWASKHQEIISLSTTESEYVAIVHASKEALWLRLLIRLDKFSRRSTHPSHSNLTTYLPSCSHKTISTMHVPSTSTFVFTSSVGLCKTRRSK